MKHLKLFLKILLILILVTQNSFAASKPVPSIGIVVKKNPGTGGQAIVTTSNNGGFSTQLEEGEYELSFPQDQLKSVINSIISRNYPKSTYQYDGLGVELLLNNPDIIVMLKPAEGNIYTIEVQNSYVTITVPRGGATLSGILSWNDAVMKNSISCPDGFVMQNGKCVPIINSASENRGIDKKDIRRNVIENSSDKTNRKGWDGSIKGSSKKTENTIDETQQKAIDAGSKETTYSRISMNITVPKQTQSATFGEKVNSGKINVTIVKGGCIILFPSDEGYRINTAKKSIQELSRDESIAIGEKVNQGLHAAGGALAQGASLLGGALPGGAVISAAVSSVGNLAGGAGGGAAAASYAATGRMKNTDSEKKSWEINDNDGDVILALPDGEFELAFVVVEKATSGLKDTLKTQVRIGFIVENGVLKTNKDSPKSVSSIIR
ncbi:MAG: hypothetical protein ACOH1N_10630 [Lutibacter sp.]